VAFLLVCLVGKERENSFLYSCKIVQRFAVICFFLAVKFYCLSREKLSELKVVAVGELCAEDKNKMATFMESYVLRIPAIFGFGRLEKTAQCRTVRNR